MLCLPLWFWVPKNVNNLGPESHGNHWLHSRTPLFLPLLREVCLKLLEALPQHCFSYLLNASSCSTSHCYNLMIVVDSHYAYCCALHVVSFHCWTQLPVYTQAFLPKHSFWLRIRLWFCEGLFHRSSDRWPIEISKELSAGCQGNTSSLLLFMRSRDWPLTSLWVGCCQSSVHSWLQRASWNLEDLLNNLSPGGLF